MVELCVEYFYFLPYASVNHYIGEVEEINSILMEYNQTECSDLLIYNYYRRYEDLTYFLTEILDGGCKDAKIISFNMDEYFTKSNKDITSNTYVFNHHFDTMISPVLDEIKMSDPNSYITDFLHFKYFS